VDGKNLISAMVMKAKNSQFSLLSLFLTVSCHSALRAEWQDCFVMLCAIAQKVQNKGWQSANWGLWIITYKSFQSLRATVLNCLI
jgi:hypothetical protein